jgi:hypothetical protein
MSRAQLANRPIFVRGEDGEFRKVAPPTVSPDGVEPDVVVPIAGLGVSGLPFEPHPLGRIVEDRIVHEPSDFVSAYTFRWNTGVDPAATILPPAPGPTVEQRIARATELLEAFAETALGRPLTRREKMARARTRRRLEKAQDRKALHEALAKASRAYEDALRESAEATSAALLAYVNPAPQSLMGALASAHLMHEQAETLGDDIRARAHRPGLPEGAPASDGEVARALDSGINPITTRAAEIAEQADATRAVVLKIAAAAGVDEAAVVAEIALILADSREEAKRSPFPALTPAQAAERLLERVMRTGRLNAGRP